MIPLEHSDDLAVRELGDGVAIDISKGQIGGGDGVATAGKGPAWVWIRWRACHSGVRADSAGLVGSTLRPAALDETPLVCDRNECRAEYEGDPDLCRAAPARSCRISVSRVPMRRGSIVEGRWCVHTAHPRLLQLAHQTKSVLLIGYAQKVADLMQPLVRRQRLASFITRHLGVREPKPHCQPLLG